MSKEEKSTWRRTVSLLVMMAGLAGLAGVGCRAATRDGETGTVRMQLVTSTGGTSYRLHNARFDVTGPTSATLDSEVQPGATQLTTPLPQGTFAIALVDGWDLEREDGGVFRQVEATLVSANPTSFDIAAGMTTNVAFQFMTDGTLVTVGTGTLNVTIQVIATGADGGTSPDGGGGMGGGSSGPIFAAAVSHTVTDPTAQIGLADLDSNGSLDVVVGSGAGNQLGILLNDGHGALAPVADLVTEPTPATFAIADFDRDGIPDVITADYDASALSLFIGLGAGAFRSATTAPPGPTMLPSGGQPFGAVVADFDGDGLVDVAVTDFTDSNVAILRNAGGGSLAPIGFLPAGTNPIAIAAGDLNGDGRTDLVVANQADSDVGVYLNSGAGSFAPFFPLPTELGATDVAVRDLNGDAKPDLIVATGAGIAVLLNLGGGTFGAPTQFPTGSGAFWVGVADVNGDGAADVVIPDQISADVGILLGDRHGGFAPALHQSLGGAPAGVALGDLNGDGRIDVVVGDALSGIVSVLLNVGTR